MKSKVIILGLIFCYVLVVVPFSSYLKNRPVMLKLGYVPAGKVLRAIVGDQRYLTAEIYIVRVLFYFGELFGINRERVAVTPEYFNMYRTLENAVLLDPYNTDAYYFSQAAFTWELGRVREVNSMLKHGMKYRTWDYQLPFFVGFNSAFFLNDYQAAAEYMKRAAELSGNPLFTNLAARYFYEAGKTDFGIAFLETMAKSAHDRKLKRIYEVRIEALRAERFLAGAVDRFEKERGRMPESLRELVTSNLIEKIPLDPYGGRFYLDRSGKVRSTSKFAFRE
ncbi:MAG: hypothetical protein PHO83_15745 [Geobacteraceae bacterium]|nr:hypothetical protein [Geobacteraceae bacterium]